MWPANKSPKDDDDEEEEDEDINTKEKEAVGIIEEVSLEDTV